MISILYDLNEYVTETKPTGVIPSRLLSILRGVQIRGSSLICINFAVLRNSYGNPNEDTLSKLRVQRRN